MEIIIIITYYYPYANHGAGIYLPTKLGDF
jgi:hypothetical protein